MSIGSVSAASSGMSQSANPIWTEQASLLLEIAEGIKGDIKLVDKLTNILETISKSSQSSETIQKDSLKKIQHQFNELVAYLEASSPEVLDSLDSQLKRKRGNTHIVGGNSTSQAQTVSNSSQIGAQLINSVLSNQTAKAELLSLIHSKTSQSLDELTALSETDLTKLLEENIELLVSLINEMLLDGIQGMGEIHTIMALLGQLGMHVDVALTMPDLMDTIKQEIIQFIASEARSATTPSEIRELIGKINQMAQEAIGTPIISSSEEENLIELVNEETPETPEAPTIFPTTQPLSVENLSNANASENQETNDTLTRVNKQGLSIRTSEINLAYVQGIDAKASSPAIAKSQSSSNQHSDSQKGSGKDEKNVAQMMEFLEGLVTYKTTDSLYDIQDTMDEMEDLLKKMDLESQ